MADATTLPTASPKQLGKQLRAVRRRKGLSLSEVARGAGLSRRELVNYERGKVEIPESDLWVLAGSCGVDVAELVPPTEALALNAAPASIEDTITQLRSTQADAGLSRHLDTLYALRALPAGSTVQLQEREREAMAEALGNDASTIEAKLVETMHLSKDEARRLRALIVPDAPRYTPLAIEAPEPEPEPVAEPDFFAAEPSPAEPLAAMAAHSISAFDAEVPSGPVDVFEELAKLPEPVALPDPSEDLTDFLAPQREPAAFATAGHDSRQDAFAAWPAFRSALPEPTGEATGDTTGDPILVDMQTATAATAATTYAAEHAPPIDVVGRTGQFETYERGGAADPLPTREPSTWEPTPPIWDATWTADGGGSGPGGPTDIVEFVDDYVTESTDNGATAGITDAETSPLWSTWNRAEFVDEAVEIDEVVDAPVPAPPADKGPWDHEPDPAATSSGFYVDWGTEPTDESTDEPAFEATVEATVETETSFEPTTTFEPEAFEPTAFEPAAFEPAAFEPAAFEPETFEPAPSSWEITSPDEATPESTDAWEPTGSWNGSTAWDTTSVADVDTDVDTDARPWDEVTPDDEQPFQEQPADDEPAIISWRPLADTVLAAVAVELATVAPDTYTPQTPTPDTLTPDTLGAEAVQPDFEPETIEPSFEPETIEPETIEPETIEEFVLAGPEWDLGNAVPLVEVRGQGGLVMRRADERWALADITTAPSFALEVDVDFRSGPGFGVLFRASTDVNGHMSGYSFDVDPIHEGGSFLVRQWHADRELWNPIARVAAPDPSAMHGVLTLRVVVAGDRLVASVNGAAVLSVDSLDEACAERNREPAIGNRVGIQAWSSSDLVIETLRVAPH